MFSEHISTQIILFFALYGITFAVSLIAALYLLLGRANVFAPDVMPPTPLRRWTASFFGVQTVAHVLWMLYYIHCDGFPVMDDLYHSPGYILLVVMDCVLMLTTICGTLLAMLQDRRRPVMPVIAAMVPFVALAGVFILWPAKTVLLVALIYILLFYVCFTVYMVFSVRHYGRWLRDNYVDLERKEVWQTHVAVLFFTLVFFLYLFVDENISVLIFLLHIFQIVIFVFLLLRVETLQQLDAIVAPEVSVASDKEKDQASDVPHPMQSAANPVNINLGAIEQLLTDHCIATELYLRHDLSLQQLAQAIGTNRFYLSQYFSRQGITYNAFINNLRVNYFIDRCQEIAAAGQPIVARQLASESGYRSCSTFSLAFKQRTGLSVTAWLHDAVEK